MQKVDKKLIKNFMAFAFIPFIISGCVSEAHTIEKKEAKEPATVLTVGITKVKSENVSKSILATGNIAAWDLMTVQPSTGGLKVTGIFAEENKFVKKGQLLAKLDDSVLRTQLLSAMARLDNYQAQLAKVKKPNRFQDIERQQAAVEQAKANLDNAVINQQRYDSLYSQGAVSHYELDLRKNILETSQSVYKQQQEQLDLLKEGSRSEDITISQSVVNDVVAQIKQLNVLIEQTNVKAPDDGLILERFVHLGDVASSMGKFFTIVRDNRFDLLAKVPESELNKIKAGSSVEISSDVNSALKTTGKVRQIGPTVDQANRQAIIKIGLDYIPGIHVGQFVKAKILAGKTSMLTLPARAVIEKDGNEYVFTLKKDIATLTPVRTGGYYGDKVEISKGLKLSEDVINEGAGFLKNGDRVRVIRKGEKI